MSCNKDKAEMFNEFFVVFTHVQEDLTQLPPRRQVTVLKELNDITFYVCKGVTMPTNIFVV